MMTRICQTCGIEFPACHSWRKHCSMTCSNSKVKKSLSEFKGLALRGTSRADIARQLGVNTSTVYRALQQHGLYRQWSIARYQKCK